MLPTVSLSTLLSPSRVLFILEMGGGGQDETIRVYSKRKLVISTALPIVSEGNTLWTLLKC